MNIPRILQALRSSRREEGSHWIRVRHLLGGVMPVLGHSAFVVLLIFAALGGSQFRIAKITIMEQSGPQTIYRICLPETEPDVIAMTDRNFMCHLYDCYGFRHLGGFGKATE